MEEVYIFSWCNFANILSKNLKPALDELEKSITNRTFLVNDKLSKADEKIYQTLMTNDIFLEMLSKNEVSSNILRYVNHMKSLNLLVKIKEVIKETTESKTKMVEAQNIEINDLKFEEGGKYIALKDAINGHVCVRFPPEASGYLHIGHAKAALINFHYRNEYQGKLIMRFDDTNPDKESEVFENIILKDVESLGIKYDHFSYTSDHFELLLKYCDQLIIKGDAYVDFTDPELMKTEREKCIDSTCRNQSVEENLRLWNEMKSGSTEGKKCCVRIKMDMQSKNGCMRDPTIYRCKSQSHLRTKDNYKVYPTYDFACPIVDSVEGVTHSLRTSEYNDRNDQFYRILDMLKLRKPTIADYSRLNLQNTVLSKRKLTWIVDQGFVDGWDDPRMPTVQGILRRGMTIEGLQQFILAQGFGRCNVVMEWDKIWAFNKKVIDPIVPRFTALPAFKDNRVIVEIIGQNSDDVISVPKHPKNPEVGNKDIHVTPKVYVDKADANDFVVGSNVTFINWGNMLISEVVRSDATNEITKVTAKLNVDDKNFKNTQKITWIPIGINGDYFIPVSAVFYTDLITKNILDKNDDFKDFINKDSKREEFWIGDVDLAGLKKGEIIQIQRKGFFICDEEYQYPKSGLEYPLVIINIPEGNKKERVTTGRKTNKTNDGKQEKGDNEQSKKDKKAEKEKKKEEKKLAKDMKKEAKSNAEESKNVNMTVKKNDSKVEMNKSVVNKQTQQVEEKAEGMKKVTRVGMEASKEEDLPKWYRQILTKTDMLHYYDISGCYIMLPWSEFVWKQIEKFINKRIKILGVKNCHFPLFISEDVLCKEKDHINDFTPEVAWVTRAGDKDFDKPIAIRPTSETAMYPYYANRIQTHRDLPLKLNQWCNVVRWEFKQPTPFLRSREFYWQEGHTAFASKTEAENEVYEILDIYASTYEDLLAIPVVRGRKTEKEKFAGADFTTTVEVYIEAAGRAIQGATSHHLGQNFSKMFNITYQSTSGENEIVYQNSWGFTTRSIGVMVMVHGDNKGLVMPPRVVETQVVIVPVGITAKTTEEEKKNLYETCGNLEKQLNAKKIRAYFDSDDFNSPGYKFNHWELKGVPIRIDLGPKELKDGKLSLCYRYNMLKESINISDVFDFIPSKLDQIQADMLQRARVVLNEYRTVAYTMKELCEQLNENRLITVPFCGDKSCEDQIKTISAAGSDVIEGAPSMGAKSLCIPFDQPKLPLGEKCVQCDNKPKYFTMFGRSY